MKRLVAVGAGLVLALSVAGVAVRADTSGGCNTRQCVSSGQSVDAFWTTFTGNVPTPGVVQTDTSISAGLGRTTGSGGRSSNSGACIDVFTYSYDANGNLIPALEASGCANPGDATISIANSLSDATVTATIQLVTCTFDANGNSTCSDPVPTALAGMWTATGPKDTSQSTFHDRVGGTTTSGTFKGDIRIATATVALGGSVVQGVLIGAHVADSHLSQVQTCHSATC